MHSDFQRGWLSAAQQSDRVQELADELSDAQRQQLASMLQATTYCGWLDWLRDHRGDIAQYDALTRGQRSKRLSSKRAAAPSAPAHTAPADDHPLRLHHAAAYLAVLEAYTGSLMPPRGMPLETDRDHRSLLLELLTRLPEHEDEALWPFENPPDYEGPSPYWPFARD